MTSSRCVAVVQARMGSTRLPGKVLLDVGGKTVLAHCVERAARARRVDEVVVATSELERDDVIVEACSGMDVPSHRGSEDDVLARVIGAARSHGAGIVVRLTADCPLLDPHWIDECIDVLRAENLDWVANDGAGYMRGYDVEAVRMAALEQAERDATLPYHRSHVTPYLYEPPTASAFRTRRLDWPIDGSPYRMTLDAEADLTVIRAVYEALAPLDPSFGYEEVIRFFARSPAIAAINRETAQKPLHHG
jgi:spore coat polysaccharide biosynthesis protein SpsF